MLDSRPVRQLCELGSQIDGSSMVSTIDWQVLINSVRSARSGEIYPAWQQGRHTDRVDCALRYVSVAALPTVITILQSTAPADGDKPVAFTLMGRARNTRIERPGGLHSISMIVVMNGWR